MPSTYFVPGTIIYLVPSIIIYFVPSIYFVPGTIISAGDTVKKEHS